VLVQLEEFLYQQQLTRDWSPSPSRTGPVQGEGSLGFQHLWSVLSFLFCITESVDNLSHSTDNLTQRWVDSATTNTNYTAALHYRDRTLISSCGMTWHGRDQSDAEASDQRSTITNEAEFGHGFCFAGCVLLHILVQRCDAIRYVKTYSLYVCMYVCRDSVRPLS